MRKLKVSSHIYMMPLHKYTAQQMHTHISASYHRYFKCEFWEQVHKTQGRRNNNLKVNKFIIWLHGFCMASHAISDKLRQLTNLTKPIKCQYFMLTANQGTTKMEPVKLLLLSLHAAAFHETTESPPS